MYPLLESIRVMDGNPQGLYWHQLRMETSCREFLGSSLEFRLDEILKVQQSYRDGLVKARVTYNAADFSVSFEHYRPKKVRSLKLVWADELDYAFKYQDRTQIDRYYATRGRCDDVLFVKNGLITDSSYANILLYDGKQWHTPRYPLLAGTERAQILYRNAVKLTDIRPEELPLYQGFQLINAMMPFSPGNISSLEVEAD